MKALNLIVLTLCFSMAAGVVSAQEKKTGEVTQECMQNLSLFTTSCKHKNYADALGPWEKAYADCPYAHKNIYILGVQIVSWQIDNEKDAAKKEELFQKLMKVYDDQILYFGNDPKDPVEEILADKAVTSLKYKPNDLAMPYKWLKDAVTKLGADCGATHIQTFLTTSYSLYKKDPSLTEQFISDYTMCSNAIDGVISTAKPQYKSTYEQYKAYFDNLFAQSGAADCDKLNEIYAPQIEKNKADLAYLQRTMNFFKRLDCTDEEAYFAASTYAHAIQPSAESATGLGSMCYSKKDYAKAIEYFQEAANLAATDEDKASELMRIATCYNAMNNNAKTREYAKLAIQKNPNTAAAYLLLGYIYANAGTISDDPVLNKTKYWAAVDQFIKARNADPSEDNVKQANELIRAYSAHFPTKEEIFMHPDIEEGKTYFVGSWISESTTARAK